MVAQTQRRYEVAHPIAYRPKRRKKENLLRALIHNQMVCVLLLAVGVLLLLIPYASAYARVTQKGYHKADLLSQIRSVRLENESLRLGMEELRQPSRIAAFALENGMVQGKALAYIRPAERPNLAQNTERGNMR